MNLWLLLTRIASFCWKWPMRYTVLLKWKKLINCSWKSARITISKVCPVSLFLIRSFLLAMFFLKLCFTRWASICPVAATMLEKTFEKLNSANVENRKMPENRKLDSLSVRSFLWCEHRRETDYVAYNDWSGMPLQFQVYDGQERVAFGKVTNENSL